MFLPQVMEKDAYTVSGRQIDDINSLAEYIDQVVLDNEDSTPEDEDDDSGQNFHPVKAVDFFYHPFFSQIDAHKRQGKAVRLFSDPRSARILAPSYDIVSPPPKA